MWDELCAPGKEPVDQREPLPRWRIAAAVVILAGLVGFLAMFAPIYFRNLRTPAATCRA